jgi:hypothetical protein
MADSTVNQEGTDDLDRLYEQVMTCEPAVPKDQVEGLSNMVFSKERIIRAWRMTALLAGEGGEFYADLANNAEKARAFAPIVGALSEFSETLKGMAELADSASARILVAGCNHENFTDWRKESA